MPVGLLTLELGIEHAHSLKDRRQAVRSLKDRLRHSFNVSVAELDEVTVWNRATLGVAALSASLPYLTGQLQEIEAAARRLCVGLGCDLLDSFVEVLEAAEAAEILSSAEVDQTAEEPRSAEKSGSEVK